MPEIVKKQPPKIDRYVDPTGEFSAREFKMAEWYIKHKTLLKKIGTGILAAWCIVSVSYGLGNFIYYLLVGYNEDQIMYQREVIEVQNYEALKIFYAPTAIQVKGTGIYPAAPNKYDLVAPVVNPNTRWSAYLKYKFVYSGGQTDIRETVLLPLENRPIIYFGADNESYINGAQLVLVETNWRRANPHAIQNVATFINERKIFSMENFVFTSAAEQNADTSKIEFDLSNDSAYGYYQPEFYVEMYNADGIVGYLYLKEDKFKAGEKRHVDLRSLINELYVENIKVIPVVDVFDPAQYMKVE